MTSLRTLRSQLNKLNDAIKQVEELSKEVHAIIEKNEKSVSSDKMALVRRRAAKLEEEGKLIEAILLILKAWSDIR